MFFIRGDKAEILNIHECIGQNPFLVADALNRSRLVFRGIQRRQKHRRQNRDDRNHDEELYQGENPFHPAGSKRSKSRRTGDSEVRKMAEKTEDGNGFLVKERREKMQCPPFFTFPFDIPLFPVPASFQFRQGKHLQTAFHFISTSMIYFIIYIIMKYQESAS